MRLLGISLSVGRVSVTLGFYFGASWEYTKGPSDFYLDIGPINLQLDWGV